MAWKERMSRDVFCTYFDNKYAARGRALIESIRSHQCLDPIFVLALDDCTYSTVLAWEYDNVHVIDMAEIESSVPGLKHVKATRNTIEYYFTLTPILCEWVANKCTPDALVTYLDADLAFFDSPQMILQMLEDTNVAIIPHNFTWEQRWRRRYGLFNVGWVSFRNNDEGRRCLAWWRMKCLEWCFDYVSDGRFADQGYLDKFPQLFSGVTIVDHPGVNVAPWNLRRLNLSVAGNSYLLANEKPLVFFHFHGLKQEGRRFYFKHFPYFARTTPLVRQMIYGPYCEIVFRYSSRDSQSAHSGLERSGTLGLLSHLLKRMMRFVSTLRGDYFDVQDGTKSPVVLERE